MNLALTFKLKNSFIVDCEIRLNKVFYKELMGKLVLGLLIGLVYIISSFHKRDYAERIFVVCFSLDLII